MESNGCQIMPSMAMPASPSAALQAAMINPTSAASADVGARATQAVNAVGAASAGEAVDIAWAYYMGDSATCTKVGDVCQHTPSAMADTMGAAFETKLHYGHSVARVKARPPTALRLLTTPWLSAATPPHGVSPAHHPVHGSASFPLGPHSHLVIIGRCTRALPSSRALSARRASTPSSWRI